MLSIFTKRGEKLMNTNYNSTFPMTPYKTENAEETDVPQIDISSGNSE